MHIQPSEFWQMTFWEWDAAYNVYLQANGIESGDKIDVDEARQLVKDHAQW